MNLWLLMAVLFAPVVAAQQAPTPAEVDIDVPVRDYSAAEIQLLQELEVERVKLERRSQALELREKLVDLAEERLSKKIVELKQLQDSLGTLLGNLSEMEEAEIKQLARIYENMKPGAAAEVLNKLDNAIVYDVFKRMDNKKTAKIMESLALPKARLISEMLAERSDLPPLEVPVE